MIGETFKITRRFCGPSQSGNGGYVCGRLAKHVVGPALVRLRATPPLEVELRVETSDQGALLLDGDRLIAEARPVDFDARAADAFFFRSRCSIKELLRLCPAQLSQLLRLRNPAGYWR